jgi:hypothetical protein
MSVLTGVAEPSPIDDAWALTQSALGEAPPPDAADQPLRMLDEPIGTGAPVVESIAGTKVGIVFVHGIGSQAAGETLFDWAGPLVRTVWAWAEQQAERDGRPFRDPVDWAQVDLSGRSTPLLQLAIPPALSTPDGSVHPPQFWIMTEAWWAADVKPAGLAEMAAWGRTHVGAIIRGIVTGIRASVRRRGQDPTLPDQPGPARSRPLADAFDAVAIGLLFSGVVAVAAPVYLAIRALKALPIKQLQELSTAPLDWFLAEWFGDVRILLHDRAQAANLRMRLATTIEKVRNYGAEQVVVVAHSGGTVLSYMLLADPEHQGLDVDKFITHGQAIGLAWRVGRRDDPDSPDYDAGLRPGDRLLRGVHRQRADVIVPRWIDFHATHDVAPAFNAGGWPTPDPPDTPVAPGQRRRECDGPDESWTVSNRMSVRNDHGGYWENEEQFVIPVLRELDTVGRTGAASRFYPRPDASRFRVLRRESRVRALATWWNAWMVLLGGALLAGGVAGLLLPDRGLGALGRASADLLAPIPLLGLAAALPASWLGALVVAVLLILCSQFAVAAWNVLDGQERIAARSFEPPLVSRHLARGRMALFLVAAVGTVVLAVAPSPAAIALVVVPVGLAALGAAAKAIGRILAPLGWLPEKDRDPVPGPSYQAPDRELVEGETAA